MCPLSHWPIISWKYMFNMESASRPDAIDMAIRSGINRDGTHIPEQML